MCTANRLNDLFLCTPQTALQKKTPRLFRSATTSVVGGVCELQPARVQHCGGDLHVLDDVHHGEVQRQVPREGKHQRLVERQEISCGGGGGWGRTASAHTMV